MVIGCWFTVKREMERKKQKSNLYYFIRLYVKIKTEMLIVLLNGLVN